mmetsp:Transcript_3240/g.8033  ORF Transcript_3240/g.8033 Transcript_3240/m.8033 type:complete len:870 (+) Transcript_3240:94-2703(+)
MESLRTLDFNRKVPRDVTEATSVGGAISVCGAGVAVWLFLAQVGGFLATHHVTTLHLDVADTYGSYAQAAGVPASGPLGERHTHPLLISFNVTMPHVPCSVLSLDVADHRGLHRYDRKRNVFRLRIDENGKSLGLYSAPFIKEGGLLDARRGAAPADKNGPPQNKNERPAGVEEAPGVPADPTARALLSLKSLKKERSSTGRRLLFGVEGTREPDEPATEPSAEPAFAAAQAGAGVVDAVLEGVDTGAAVDGVADTGAAVNGLTGTGAADTEAAVDGVVDNGAADTGAADKGAMDIGAADTGAVVTVTETAGKGEFVPSLAWANIDDPAGPVPDPLPADEMTMAELVTLVDETESLFVNFYAPWCYWSKQLEPEWDKMAFRLRQRAYGREGGVPRDPPADGSSPRPRLTPEGAFAPASVRAIKIDCTTATGRSVCQGFGVNAFPSVRMYRKASLQSFEPYEEPRNVKAMWRVLVARAGDALAHRLHAISSDKGAVAARAYELLEATDDLETNIKLGESGAFRYLEQAGELQSDLKESREVRGSLLRAVYGLLASKGDADDATNTFKRGQRAYALTQEMRGDVEHDNGPGRGGGGRGRPKRELLEIEAKQKLSKFAGHGYDYLASVLGEAKLAELAEGAPVEGARLRMDAVADAVAKKSAQIASVVDPDAKKSLRAPAWLTPATDGHTHSEGCVVFGSVEVPRAPGQIHIAPHSRRQSIDLSNVNVSHYLEHLAFGSPLDEKSKSILPVDIRVQLNPLDGTQHFALQPHLSIEHFLRVSATSFTPAARTLSSTPTVRTHQFLVTTHRHAKEAIPAIVISYDISPLHLNIKEERTAASQLLLSTCAIIGGVVSFFGLLDGAWHSATRAMTE